MNLLDWIFNILEPNHKLNWLSVRFSRWKRDRDKKIKTRIRSVDIDSVYFDVPGAGDIRMSNHCKGSTGRAFGFLFDVSWSIYPYCGGVIDREEAKKMAEFILEKYSQITQEEKDKEQKELIERDKRLEKYFAND